MSSGRFLRDTIRGIMEKFKKVMKWVVIVFGGAYILLVISRIPHAIDKQKTDEQVARIHATKLTMDDVLGTNLPLDPGAEADKTIAGIDANRNGIRDDVELAIFKEYPNSAKTRAVLLQYALMMQMEMTLPLLNNETATAAVEDNESRANICTWTLSSRSDMNKFTADLEKYRNFVKQRQINTGGRENYINNFYKYLVSYSASGDGCDLDPSIFSN